MAASGTWKCHAVTPTGMDCQRAHPPGMLPSQLWCPYHQRLREGHIAKDLCPTIHRDRKWCMNPRNPNYEHCITCKIEQDKERKRKEQEAERQRQHEVEWKRQQKEHELLEAQPWFPALVRYLDGRLEEKKNQTEEWVAENYVADKGDTYSWS